MLLMIKLVRAAGGKWDDYKQAGDRWREMSIAR
jgi:hypothetical protein